MKCSICNSEMSHSGICPVCGNEADRSKIALQSEESETMDISWVDGMEKARIIANICGWLGIVVALYGAYQYVLLKNEAVGIPVLTVGVVIYGVEAIFAEIVNRCPSCKRRFGFGGKYRNKWRRYSNCPRCGKALYGHLADEDRTGIWS